MAKTFSKDEISSHSKPDNLWIIIDEDVFDLTQFQDEHPGRSHELLARNVMELVLTMMASSRWKEEYVPLIVYDAR